MTEEATKAAKPKAKAEAKPAAIHEPTRREWFAGMALQGLLANSNNFKPGTALSEIVDVAVKVAELLDTAMNYSAEDKT